jgi:hypothetical protein
MIYLILTIIYIFIMHFVGDFVFQTREMANNKSKSNKWLTIHVLAYFQALIWGSILFCGIHYIVLGPIDKIGGDIILYCVSNAILHWVTDYFTSKQTSKLWTKQNVKGFFTMIGFDQVIHQTTLIITFYFFFMN